MIAIVTGAAGFVGRWLVEQLLSENHMVIGVVKPNGKTVHTSAGKGHLKVVACDLDDYEELPTLIGKHPGAVFYHLAWSGVSGHDRGDLEIQNKNVLYSVLALEASEKIGCRRFISLGSMMEEESFAATQVDGLLPSPGYTYGSMKCSAHLQTKIMAAQLGIEHIWPILTNAYGEFENSPRLINSTLRKIIHKEPLEFTSGKHLCDFVYVGDAVRALSMLGVKGKSFHRYVIGSGKPAPVREYVEIMGRTFSPEREMLFGAVPYSGVYLPVTAFSTDALIEDTGYLPQVSFEEGIIRTMNWLKKEELFDK